MRFLFTLLALVLMTGCAATTRELSPAKQRVLIFSHSTGYRHESIAAGVPALQRLIEAEGAEPLHSEDPAIFAADRLRGIDTIILLSTTTEPKAAASEWWTGPRRDAFQNFVRSGGGVLGIHAAADSHYHWPWYGRLIGGYFRRHPPGTPKGRLIVVDSGHPSTRGLPKEHARVDEWYFFQAFEPGSRLLLNLDPRSIGEEQAGPSPMSWAREFEGGRVFYTALGHTPESYRDPYFLEHVRGGLRWTLRRN
jgi:hypothetical protein